MYSNKLIYSYICIGILVLKLYVCAVRRKVQTVLFTVFRTKVNVVLGIHGPGSNRVRMKSHYSYWLVSQSCLLTSWLFLECGRLWTFSSVAAGAGAGRSFCCRCRCRSFCNFCCSASSTFSPFLSAKYRIGQRSILCCHEDKVW